MNTTIEKETVNEKTTACNKQIMFMPCNRYRDFSGIVHSDFSFFKNDEPKYNNILFLYKIDKDYNIYFINRCDILLVYFHTHNNLLVVSTNQLIYFLMNNQDIIQKLKIYNNLILYTNGCIITKPLKQEEKEKPINTLHQSFNVNIKSSYVINNQSYLIKYIKYKNKYLNLTKNNF